MSIDSRIKKLEKTLERRHNLLYEKPTMFLIEPTKDETSEQAKARYELEHNTKILDRDFVVILSPETEAINVD